LQTEADGRLRGHGELAGAQPGLTLVPDPQPAQGLPARRPWMQGEIEQGVPKHLATWLDQVRGPALLRTHALKLPQLAGVSSDSWLGGPLARPAHGRLSMWATHRLAYL
jgi:hypothetical protein